METQPTNLGAQRFLRNQGQRIRDQRMARKVERRPKWGRRSRILAPDVYRFGERGERNLSLLNLRHIGQSACRVLLTDLFAELV